jgi:RNA polymerase sigma-70 factor, ECF subfamily
MAGQAKSARRGERTTVSVDELQLGGGAPSPELVSQRRQILRRLISALPSIGVRCRELLKHKLSGRSFAEIRELMGARSVNTVYTWDLRCRRLLLRKLGGSWEAFG